MSAVDAQALAGWLAVLDRLSYYDLFGLPPNASYDQVRAAFHAFAEDFHPDGHRARPDGERRAVNAIFKRGAEALRILTDPQLRVQYDQALALSDQSGARAAVSQTRSSSSSGSIAPAPQRLIDTVRSPGARPFVLRAEELQKKGDFKQAKLQLTMALHMEPGNTRLDAMARELDELAKKQTEDDKKSWKK